MKLELIMAIVIPCIIIVGTVIIHLVEFFQKNDVTCKVWAEQWDDLDKKLKYSKLGLIYPPNNDTVIVKADRILQDDVIKFIKDENLKQLYEEKARVLDNMMRSSKQFEVALEQSNDYIKGLVPKPEVLTFEATMSPNDMRKMLGLDEIEEHEATIEDFTVKRVYSYDDRATITDEVVEEELKPKKLEPLICKMCGGTVAKNGDIYECEYCGLKYEWR